MRSVDTLQKHTLFSFVFLTIALTFVLAGCGATTGTGSSGSGSTASTPTHTTQGAIPPIATQGSKTGYGTTHGCPSNAVVTTAPSQANIIITSKSVSPDQAIVAHTGDVIEIRLAFGIGWNGPTSSQGALTLQKPSGYAWTADQSCIWRFVATSTGTVALEFNSRPLCNAHMMCPQYIRVVPITIKVQ